MICQFCKQKVIGPYWRHLAFDPPLGCPEVGVALGRYWPWKDKETRPAPRSKNADLQKLVIEQYFRHRKEPGKIARELLMTRDDVMAIVRASKLKVCLSCRLHVAVKGKEQCVECIKSGRKVG